MQKVKEYAPWIAAVAGSGAIANAGYVLNAALSMSGSNLSVLAQALFSLLLGLGGVGYAAKSSSGPVAKSSTFDDDMKSISQLAKSCGGQAGVQEALEVVQKASLDKQMPPITVASTNWIKG